MQKEILFDELTARDMAERLRMRAEIDAYLNTVCLTVARMNGCAPTDRVMLNASGTGIIVAPPAPPKGREEVVESEMPADGGDGEKPAFAKASAGKK